MTALMLHGDTEHSAALPRRRASGPRVPGAGALRVEPLVAGDVLAIEPGVRFEDLALVTEHGCELLTYFSCALDPRQALAG